MRIPPASAAHGHVARSTYHPACRTYQRFARDPSAGTIAWRYSSSRSPEMLSRSLRLEHHPQQRSAHSGGIVEPIVVMRSSLP
jgi:hypothetical protein